MENNTQQKQDGLTLNTAIKVDKAAGGVEHQIYNAIDRLYGGGESNYFILSEQVTESRDRSKKYKVVYVECSDGVKRSVVFDISD